MINLRVIQRVLVFGAAIAISAAGAEGLEPATSARPIWADRGTNTLGGPSPNGRYLSFVDRTGNLAIRDLKTDASRAVTRDAGKNESGQFAYFSIFSPDGGAIAYAWFNAEGFYELRTIGTDGSDSRTLYRNAEAGFVQPCAFSPDGKQILTLLFRKDNVSQIALVSTEDGSARILRSLNWFYPKKIDFSPDGRFVVYDSTVDDDEPERDIHVLTLDGGGQSTITDHPANDLFPLWTPNGKAVVFGSDRAGTMDLWMIPVTDGKPAGEAVLVKKELGRALPMAFTQDGTLFYGLKTGQTDVYAAEFNLASGGLSRKAKPIASRFRGENRAPEWSADGRYLAYLSRIGTENYGQEYRVVTIRDMETQKEVSLPPRLAYVDSLRWSPDSASLLLSGSDNKGRAGVFRLEITTGSVTPMIVERNGDFRGFEAAWSRDGKKVYYVQPTGADSSMIRLHDSDKQEAVDVYRPGKNSQIRLLRRAWNSDSLAFSVAGGGDGRTQSLFVLHPGEDVPKKLLHSQYGGLSGVEWTPDDKHVLVSTESEFGAGLWRVSLADADPHQLNAGWKGPGPIRLSPDGKQIAFAQGESKEEVWVIENIPAVSQ